MVDFRRESEKWDKAAAKAKTVVEKETANNKRLKAQNAGLVREYKRPNYKGITTEYHCNRVFWNSFLFLEVEKLN